MKKKLIIFVLISIFLIIFKFYFSNYELKYEIDSYQINTIYEDERYYFELDGKYKFNFDVYKNRSLKYTFIDRIDEIVGDDFYCIYPHIEYINTYPLCYQNDTIVDYNLISSSLLDKYKSKNDESIKKDETFNYYNSLGNNTYVALWNYKGYIVMNGKDYKNVDIFKNDKYDNTLAFQNDKYIYMADYNSDHEYKKLVEFNITNDKINYIDLNVTIDFDSYFVGVINKKIYIFDNKNSILYEVNLKNGKAKIIGSSEKGFIKFVNGKELSCSKKEYKSDKITYTTYNSNYKYNISDSGVIKTIKDNKSISIKISDKNINKIHEYQNTLYYIFGDKLYMYNPVDGNKEVFYYFELNFNKENTIFVYNE